MIIILRSRKKIFLANYWQKLANILYCILSNTDAIEFRDVAQFGRVPALGVDGRRFKSYYPDLLQ